MNQNYLLDDSTLKRFEEAIASEKIHTCQIYQGDQIVFSYCIDRSLLNELHMVNSVTKSILSILVGIAIDRGEIAHVNESVAHYFPHLRGAHRELTLRHLLTMTQGIDWREMGDWGGLPFPMLQSEDWVQFTLEQEIIEPLGERMIYNSGSSQILSAIMQLATGRTLSQYAVEHLFTPLGIAHFNWITASNGIVVGGFGLEMMINDMMKIGRLMLNEGSWNDEVIVSSAWVKESTTPYYHTYHQIGSYGYHWWVLTNRGHRPLVPHAYTAIGYGGQLITVVPDRELVITFTSDLKKQSARPLRYVKDILIKK